MTASDVKVLGFLRSQPVRSGDLLQPAGHPNSWLRPLLFPLLFLPPQLLTLLARIFISAHFPHQCLAGLLVGLAAVRLAYLPGPGRVAWLSARPAWLLVVWSLLVPASSFAVYSGLKVRK
jgi:hypothetical protein